MARKRVVRKKPAPPRPKGRSTVVMLVVIVMIIAALFLTRKNAEEPPAAVAAAPATVDLQFSLEEAQQMVNRLLVAIQPANEENRYFPQFAQDRINWLYLEVERKRIDLRYELSPSFPGKVGEALMSSYYHDGLPTVVIYADRLFVTIRLDVDGGSSNVFTSRQKNAFAAALVHETVHLERARAWFETRGNDVEEISAEEFRTYSIVDRLVIEPLLRMGQPIDEHHRVMHDILLSCNYAMPCQAFRDYTQTKTSARALEPFPALGERLNFYRQFEL